MLINKHQFYTPVLRHVRSKLCVWTHKGKKNKQRVETGPLQNWSVERKREGE